MSGSAVAAEATLAAQEFADGVVRRAGLAEGGPPLRAGSAMAATRHEHADDEVALLQVVNERADLLDNAGGLVAERHRQRPWPVAVDDGEIGMAQARRRNADQDLARSRSFQVDLLNPERARLRVRGGQAHLFENRGLDLHDGLSSVRVRLRVCRAPAPAHRRASRVSQSARARDRTRAPRACPP